MILTTFDIRFYYPSHWYIQSFLSREFFPAICFNFLTLFVAGGVGVGFDVLPIWILGNFHAKFLFSGAYKVVCIARVIDYLHYHKLSRCRLVVRGCLFTSSSTTLQSIFSPLSFFIIFAVHFKLMLFNFSNFLRVCFLFSRHSRINKNKKNYEEHNIVHTNLSQ